MSRLPHSFVDALPAAADAGIDEDVADLLDSRVVETLLGVLDA